MAILSSPPPKPKLTTVLLESRKIIKSQPRHLFAFSFALFFFPLAVSAFFAVKNGTTTTTPASAPNHPDHDHPQGDLRLITAEMITNFLYGCFTMFFTLVATISTTYVTFRTFHNDPVELKSTLKLISASFFHLLATILIQWAIVVVITTVCIMGIFLVVVAICGISIFEGASLYYIGCLMATPLLLGIIYQYVVWAFASAVVVVESTWGFEALKQSSSLVKGKKFLSFAFVLIFEVLYTVLSYGIAYLFPPAGVEEKKMNKVAEAVLFVVVVSSLKAMIAMYRIVVTTVFYVYCKAVYEKEFPGDLYARVAVDDSEKIDTGVFYAKI